MLVVNEVFKDKTTNEIYRVLWIDEGYIICYVIDITAKKPFPLFSLVKDILENFEQGNYEQVEDKTVSNKFLSKKQSDIEYRNNAWELIRVIVNQEPDVYIRNKRGKLIREVAQEHNISENTVWKHLRKFWKNGMSVNSLFPDFNNCGKTENDVYIKKAGRPRKLGGGLNITNEIKELFQKSINKYYLNNKKSDLTFAYKKMLENFFTKSVYFDQNGKKIVLSNDYPTYGQFYYWFTKMYNQETVVKKRDGETAYERNHRGLLGSTEYDALGPGYTYQIDATPADCYLVNKLNPNWIIGKPTLYFIVDVFSRLITGFYINTKSASWLSMAAALQNAFNNKEEYCAGLGIKLTEGEWPAENLPEAIIGDNGELASKYSDALVTGLGIEISNNPPYRPDWKGIVESLFGNSQRKLHPLLPGSTHKETGDRGTKDSRIEATLTLDDYLKVIVYFINYYNHNHYMKDYVRTEEMIKDGVKPIPIDLWNWGIKNCSGGLRKFRKDIINLQLLPQDKATVTERGIRYKKMHYSCKKSIEENWFAQARKKKWKVSFSYDPRNLDVIYLHTDDGTDYIPCNLLPHQEMYKNLSIEEIVQFIDFEDIERKKHNHIQLENEINLNLKVEEIVKKAASNQKEKMDSSISKSRKFKEQKNMREQENKEREKEEVIVLEKASISRSVEGEKKTITASQANNPYSILDLFNKFKEK